jgi:DUF4097 and DUF4098 domain-containing protein YvlB
LLSVFAVAGEAPKIIRDKGGYRTEIISDYDVTSREKLELMQICGDVRVDSWKESKLRITEKIKINAYTQGEAERLIDDYRLKIEKLGNSIVALGANRSKNNVSITYEVTLPEKFAGKVATCGGDLDIKNVNGEYEFKTSGGDINMSSCQGNVFCATSGGDLILIRVKGNLTANTSGGDIRCEECGENLNLKTSGGDIALRKLGGAINARTSGGDIEADDVKGNYCTVNTSGGDIILSNIESEKMLQAVTSGGDIQAWNIKGDAEVKTSGGDISARNISGCFWGRTSGGDIETRRIVGSLKLNTSGGDIDVEDVEGFVEAVTSGGDICVNIYKYIPNTDQHIDLKSSGGDLELGLPFDFKGSLQATIWLTRVAFDEYEIVSDFPLMSGKESEKAKSRSERISKVRVGDINGGGNLIVLETTNGNIKIAKIRRSN